jgi:hypothetical protein
VPAGWIESAFIAAVISSLVTVAGWYISLRHERRREAERREERIWDYQTALLADIRSTSSQFAIVDLDQHLEEVTGHIESAPDDRPYTPFVPRAPGSLIWSSIAQEVHILPTEVIDPVVLFFSQLETIRNFVEDLRSEQFARLEKPRKVAMYRDYIRMWRLASQQAVEAQAALRTALGLSPLSSPVQGRSDPRSALAPAGEAKDEDGKSA